MLSTAYTIKYKIFRTESQTFYELVSHSHSHFSPSQPGASFMLHYHLPISVNFLECPFIWILVLLFEYIDLFQCIIMERMNISWPVIPSIRQLHKNCLMLYTCQSHLWKQVLFSCLWLPVRFVVSLKKSYPITDCFMQKEGAEPLKATSVTQVLNYFPQYVIFCAFPLLRKTTRWLARVCTMHVYVLLFMRLDTISAKSWFVSL